MAASRVVRSPVALAAATLAVLAVLAMAAVYLASWRHKTRIQVAQADGAQFAWLTKALEDCEAEASRYPGSLYFMVVPLAAVAGPGADLQSRALDRVGPTMLFDSKVAMDELGSGTLRIAREPFVLHALDIETNAEHRWNSASGVSTLSERNNTSKGPFKIRLQTAPGDPASWSSVTADGVATCHWVFALLRR
jgi:hypothetical protein